MSAITPRHVVEVVTGHRPPPAVPAGGHVDVRRMLRTIHRTIPTASPVAEVRATVTHRSTSGWTYVEVHARTLDGRAFVVLVDLDEEGRPRRAAPLVPGRHYLGEVAA